MAFKADALLLPNNVVPLKEAIDKIQATIEVSRALIGETPRVKTKRKRINLKVLARTETLPAVLATLNCFLADNQSEIVTLILNVLPD